MRPPQLLVYIAIAFVILTGCQINATAQRLTPHHITLANGKSFDLNLPEGYEINIAAQGLKRVRFMTLSPDNRLFVTDMFNLTDNRRGVVYILDDFDQKTYQFKKVTKYLSNLRNPNNVAFYSEPDGHMWFYLALTDRLVRYRYQAGDNAPSGEPQVLATFPDYGLGYKYGGWHLTRTVLVGGDNKIYVAVGSSCNACEEKEEVRASVLQMNPDGSNKHYFARGLRNAVGLIWTNDKLYATNMGSDHLGNNRPADTFYRLEDGMHYGWPYCFQDGARIYPDPKFNTTGASFDCRKVPKALTSFPAHSSPLGLEYFDSDNASDLAGSFLVALHGSTKRSLRRGYRIVRVREAGGRMEDFMTGFFEPPRINGRPADIYSFGKDAFLVTDDYSGVVYYVYLRKSA
ncbi:MAG TPA: PQQ-dependent sugar dehydrogenase [Pyrinomonadaceae bacterium]|nr:PQQ-dependent sugar dehydrogenase [Pyrinomonadaceae bacterium]